MTNLYRVTHDTKKNGDASWAIDIERKTAKEAEAKALAHWYKASKAHAFHVKTRRLKATEEFLYNWFVRV